MRRGKGSRFLVNLLLRVHSEPSKQEQRELSKRINLKGKRILLVEDNEINCEIARSCSVMRDMSLRRPTMAASRWRWSEIQHRSTIL